MDLRAVFMRAQRSLRDDLRLHVVAIASLIVAFLCLGAALLSVANLSRVSQRWSRSQHLTVYLRDGANPSEVAQLRLVLESLREVVKLEYISPERARQLFSAQTDLQKGLGELPSDAFPASLELDLASGIEPARIDKIAERVRQFGAVDDVETYRAFVGQFHSLLDAGRSGALVLAVLVVVCVIAVISNTIRLAVVNRRREIEVLKLCGATDGFVRGPFLLEGALQAVVASTLGMLLLLFGYLALHSRIETTLGALTGVRTVFLSPGTICAVIAAAGLLGALGSALSLRRYLQV